LHFPNIILHDLLTTLSSELQEQLLNIFNEIDVNKDGTVSKGELENAFNGFGLKLTD